jgi:hypothetical protein
MSQQQITNEEIATIYADVGNIWKVAELVGLSGQTICDRLDKIGVKRTGNNYLSDADKIRINEYYSTTPVQSFCLDDLASELGRTKQFICRQAKYLGLTNQFRKVNDKDKAAISNRAKEYLSKNPHPRGYLGHKHSPETRELIGVKSRVAWNTSKTFGIGHMSKEARQKRSDAVSKAASSRTASNHHTRAKGGKRSDIGDIWFRSSWEANYARYLNVMIDMNIVEKWEFEPETFWFEKIKRGVRSYLPDFKVYYRNSDTPVYIEIKGWVQDKDKTKWKRMKKYHPHIVLEIVGQKEYEEIKRKWASSIPNWE